MKSSSMARDLLYLQSGFKKSKWMLTLVLQVPDLVDLTNIGVAIDPNASKIASVRKTRKSGSAMPPFQMANKKNAATNAMMEIVAR